MRVQEQMESLFGINITNLCEATQLNEGFETAELLARDTATLAFAEYGDEPLFVGEAEGGIVVAGQSVAMFVGDDATCLVLEYENEDKNDWDSEDEDWDSEDLDEQNAFDLFADPKKKRKKLKVPADVMIECEDLAEAVMNTSKDDRNISAKIKSYTKTLAELTKKYKRAKGTIDPAYDKDLRKILRDVSDTLDYLQSANESEEYDYLDEAQRIVAIKVQGKDGKTHTEPLNVNYKQDPTGSKTFAKAEKLYARKGAKVSAVMESEIDTLEERKRRKMNAGQKAQMLRSRKQQTGAEKMRNKLRRKDYKKNRHKIARSRKLITNSTGEAYLLLDTDDDMNFLNLCSDMQVEHLDINDDGSWILPEELADMELIATGENESLAENDVIVSFPKTEAKNFLKLANRANLDESPSIATHGDTMFVCLPETLAEGLAMFFKAEYTPLHETRQEAILDLISEMDGVATRHEIASRLTETAWITRKIADSVIKEAYDAGALTIEGDTVYLDETKLPMPRLTLHTGPGAGDGKRPTFIQEPNAPKVRRSPMEEEAIRCGVSVDEATNLAYYLGENVLGKLGKAQVKQIKDESPTGLKALGRMLKGKTGQMFKALLARTLGMSESEEYELDEAHSDPLMNVKIHDAKAQAQKGFKLAVVYIVKGKEGVAFYKDLNTAHKFMRDIKGKSGADAMVRSLKEYMRLGENEEQEYDMLDESLDITSVMNGVKTARESNEEAGCDLEATTTTLTCERTKLQEFIKALQACGADDNAEVKVVGESVEITVDTALAIRVNELLG